MPDNDSGSFNSDYGNNSSRHESHEPERRDGRSPYNNSRGSRAHNRGGKFHSNHCRGAYTSSNREGQGHGQWSDETYDSNQNAYFDNRQNIHDRHEDNRGHSQSNRARPYPECRRSCSRSRSRSPPRESFEDTMEMDLDRFVPTLKFPSTADEAKELIEIADDPETRRVDAVRILLNIVDIVQWTPGSLSHSAEYILESKWVPPEWYKRLIKQPGYSCKPLHEHDHIKVELPHIEKKLLPSGIIQTPKTSSKKPKSSTSTPKSVNNPPIATLTEPVKYNDPSIHPNWDSVPGMLAFLAQSNKRLYGVSIDQNRLVVWSIHGAMLINGRLSVGDGFGMPTDKFDIAFIYICAYIGAQPGRYVDILTSEEYGIRLKSAPRQQFPSKDWNDYTPPMVAKFFANQGVLPARFDDVFPYIARISKKLTWELNSNIVLASLFLGIHQESSVVIHNREVPEGINEYGEFYPLATRDPTDKPVNFPRAPGIVKARKTKPGDVENSNELANATSSSLHIKDKDTDMEVTPQFTHPVFASNGTSAQSLLAMIARPGYAFSISFAAIDATPVEPTEFTMPTFGTTTPISPIYSSTGNHATNEHEHVGVNPNSTLFTGPSRNDDFLENVNPNAAFGSELGSSQSDDGGEMEVEG
ncbi:hypothetical protein C8J56DRAFT_1063341 [Mycena floridula]|nr:hypothetical protein C8J56DRAFT_1063341 [Mycena floridula]